MKFNSFFHRSLLGLGAAILIASGALAQTNEGLTPAHMRQAAASFISSIQSAESLVSGSLVTARQNKDVEQTLCLDGKSRQLSTALSTARTRQSALNEALASNAIERARHEFTLLGVLSGRAKILASEAGLCSREETGFGEESEINLNGGPNLQDTNNPSPNFGPILNVAPSLYGSAEWALKLSSVQENCVDPDSAACEQSLTEATDYLNQSNPSSRDLQNSLAQLIQTTGNQIGNSSSNNVAGPLSRVFDKVSKLLDNSTLSPDEKDNVLNKFTTTTIQVAQKKGLGENNTGPEAQNLGSLLNRVASKTSNTQTQQTLRTVANSLTTNGTFPSNLGLNLPSFASPA